MAIILASLLKYSTFDEVKGEYAIALDDENGILTNIARYVPRSGGRLVLVANRPDDYESSDEKLNIIRNCFALSGFTFERADVLDNRTADNARELISKADLVILRGGKCVCQNRFLRAVGMYDLLKSARGLIIGVSAGAMNLCSVVANFPEELADLDEPRFFDGLGLYDGIVIPHFDGEKKAYQFDCGDFDVAGEYILPMSYTHPFTALPNGSYIFFDGDKGTVFGTAYRIHRGVVTKLQ